MRYMNLLTWNRRTITLLLIGATAAVVALLTLSPSLAQGSPRGIVEGVTVSPGGAPGELNVSWDAPSPAPQDYRVSWAPEDERFKDVSQTDWNAYPTDNELTITGLEAGASYKVRVRARFGSEDKSGWSETAYGTAASDTQSDTDDRAVREPSEPLISERQVYSDSPATMEECGAELAAGHAVLCKANDFSVKTVRPTGQYHINWSVWASQHSNIDRYTIQRLRFLYRYNFEREDNGDAVDGHDYTVPDVNSCAPRAAEVNGRGIATRWAWRCDSITQVHEDPSGGPTSIELLDGNWISDSWTASLQAPGRKPDVPVQALKVPGSRIEAHADNPQNVSGRLTQQQVDDGTHGLLATEIEMHLYLITVHFDDGTTDSDYALIDGGSFDDR